MVAMLIGVLFFTAMTMALGTIAGMAAAYRDKALAALHGEHVPAASIRRGAMQAYSPARLPRCSTPDPRPALVTRRRHVRAA